MSSGEQTETCEDTHPFQSPTGFISQLTCDLPNGHAGRHHDDESGADWD